MGRGISENKIVSSELVSSENKIVPLFVIFHLRYS